ncbi:MAG TPA: PAS domain-containing sensor histidine kinase, partial [Cytophagales bacterium]|nr:PAS domain-containing sensor histidine kinase [Cytophagales bacterium]
TIYVGDFRFKHKKGHYFWLAASFKNFLNDRSVGAIVLNAIDITVKKEAEIVLERINADLESKVKERTEQLDKVNKELEAFSYSVSHDLRTPLRAINGYAKMLEEDYTSVFDENGKRLLKTVQYNAHQMGKLIDDLLAFSRLGKNELHKTVVNMYDLVTKVVDEVCVLYPNAAVQIHSLQNALGDANLLKQVWVNYISNALKYSSKNKQPQVELSSTAGEQEIIYTVHDNGIGFDPAYANKLFKVFQRLHSQEDFEGTGVGLAMVEKIITKHGGRFWAESNLGKGATFNFSLPVDKIMK